MARRVVLPPAERAEPGGIKAGGWWHESDDGRKLICDLCPRACALAPGKRGFCFVRQNLDGRQIVSSTYGRSTGFCIDPIEKKPLNQFFPGTAVLSFGTAGCNLGCKFCQNWSISKSREVERLSELADPETVAEAARRLDCRSVAFTYNDPIVWAEYAIDTARACRAVGVKTVAVTSGYIQPGAREAFYEVMDAANVDLKAFTEDFYFRLSGGHLEPVLDTLRWLVHESDVWVEITNLVIPGANDSPEELERMCRWILDELGPDVPIHFSAFHPDFKLTDRGPTPPETLSRAHEIARGTGLHYVYTGNVSDRQHQSTYCPGCGHLLIERDGYQLGVYALEANRCGACGAQIAGRFDQRPGTWGPRRMPVRISDYGPAEEQPGDCPDFPAGKTGLSPSQAPGDCPGFPAGKTGLSPSPEGDDPMAAASPERPNSKSDEPERPKLTADEERQVFEAAGRRVTAAVRSTPAERLDEVLADLGRKPLLGAFVSLKRAGQLRSCCGFLGQSIPLYEAVNHAAVRAAKDDPRFPPISPSELDHLDMEVWLLWGLEPVAETGEDRVGVVTIGKHGLQIARGAARGLLLPGVATEHNLDARTFLEHVCRKAGLPPGAWLDDDTTLMTFEGYSIAGQLKPPAAAADEEEVVVVAGGPTPGEVARLADFCRQNLFALVQGATPSFYLPGGYDGAVSGIALSVEIPETDQGVETSKFVLRPEIPLQSSLLEMVKVAAGAFQSGRLDVGRLATARVGLSVLWDPAMHGSEPQLEGFEPKRRAVVVVDRGKWAGVFDPERKPEELLEDAVGRMRLVESGAAAVYSLAVVSTEPRMAMSNVAQPQAGAAVRPPAVAGVFYPREAAELERTLNDMLPSNAKPEPWAGAMVPHAGWTYSGKLAAEVFSRVKFPRHVIIFSPKHRPGGADWAVAPHQTWSLPGGDVESDPELAERLAGAVTGLELDAAAHLEEHAIEVQLPIIARLAPESRVVGVAMHGGNLAALEKFADQLAELIADMPERPLMVISTDMNHYADDTATRKLDRMALDAVEELDPEKLFNTVRANRISMCGVLPAVAVMETLRRLDSLNRCEPVGYATSAEASGDTGRVVGYAGVLLG